MHSRWYVLLPSLAWCSLTAAEPIPLTISAAQADPAAVAPVTASGVPWVVGDSILVVGDLLVAPGQPEIATRLQTALAASGVTVRSLQNHGYSIDQWHAAAIAEIAAHPPRVVVFLSGVGDVLSAAAAKTTATTADVWRKALVEVTLAAQTAGAAMVIATPAMVDDKPSGGTGATELDAYAAAARAVATDTKSELCDLRVPLLVVLAERNRKGAREFGVLSKTAGQLKVEGADIVTACLATSIAAAVSKIPWTLELNGGPFLSTTMVEMRTPRLAADHVIITYTIDGTVPTEKSRLYNKPFSVSTTTQIRALAVDKTGVKHSADGWYEAITKRPADVAPSDSLPGLWVDHYTLKKWRNPMPPLDALKPDFESWWPNCELGALSKIPVHRWPNTNYGLRFTGYFIAPTDGVYVFATNSDDASRITIGDTIVVKNDDLHPVSWAYGAIELGKGYHPLTLLYGQGPGYDVLEVYVSLAGQRLQRLPDTLLRRPAIKPARKTITYVEPVDDNADTKTSEPVKP